MVPRFSYGNLSVVSVLLFSGKSLLWVAVLGLVVFYLYGIIGFALMRSMFDPADYLYCNTLWQCTITVVRYGLIGDLFEVSTLSVCLCVLSVSTTTPCGSVLSPSSDMVSLCSIVVRCGRLGDFFEVNTFVPLYCLFRNTL